MSHIGTEELHRLYVGNTEITKAYLGSSLVFQNIYYAISSGIAPLTFQAKAGAIRSLIQYGKCEQRNLPPEYTQLEYIESTGTQYIDTGVVQDILNFWVDMDVSFANPNGRCLFGVSGSSPLYFGRAQGGRFEMNQAYTSLYSGQNKRVNLQWGKDPNSNKMKLSVVVDGQTESLFSTQNGFIRNNNFVVFGNNSGDIIDYILKGKIYFAKIYKNNILVFNGIPVQHNSDNAVGMYDTISGQFFTNAGTGNFIAGPDVVPTPDKPIDIWCNNGVLKYGQYGKNLLNLDAPGVIYDNYINNNGIVVNDGISTISDFISCTEGAYYTAQSIANVSGSNLRIHGYDENKNWVQMLAKKPASVGVITTATCQIPAEIKYIKVSGYMTGHIGKDAMLELGSMATPYEPYQIGIHTEGTAETINVRGKNLFNKATISKYTLLSTTTGTPQTYQEEWYWCSAYIPVIPNTAYYFKSGANYDVRIFEYTEDKNYTSTNYTVLNSSFTVGATCKFIRFHIGGGGKAMYNGNTMLSMGSTEIPYQPYLDNNPATATNLLQVGSYKDIQDIISGDVTRRVGVKVLDGTENWAAKDQYGRTSISVNDLYYEMPRRVKALCSHFENLHNEEAITDVTVGQFYIAPTSSLYFHIMQTSTADFKQWLADQYAAGTPVIVLYPLATEITESVTPQSLDTVKGTNIIDVTAEVSDVEIDVEHRI
jgi:hypothetical protein